MTVTVDAYAWTTLDNVKEELKIDSTDTSKDEQLKRMINRSFVILEKYCGRQIKARDYTEYHDGDGTRELLLEQWPIISVTSIHVDWSRQWADSALIDSAIYVPDSKWGGVRLFGPFGGNFDANEAGIGSNFYRGVQNIRAIYRAGYETIPDDLEFCSTMHVAYHYNKAGSEGHGTLTLGSFSKSYMRGIPDELIMYLEPYKKRLSAAQ